MSRVVYVLRTFPKLSETFVLREVRELARRDVPFVVWSLLPPGPDAPAVPDAAGVLPLVRTPPRGRVRRTAALAGALLRTAVRSPGRFAREVAWTVRWSWHERDPRHVAALPYAALVAAALEPGDHVHSHFANAPTTVGLVAASLAGTTASFTAHARDVFEVTTPAFAAEKLRRAAFAAVGTAYAAERLRGFAAPADRAKVAVVRNGLDRDAGSTAPRAPEPGLVVSVARLVPKKGLDTLVEAIARLSAEGRDVRCEILGDGPQAEALRALAARLGVADRVLLRGAADRAAIDATLARAAAFALPCRPVGRDIDTAPLSILEALSFAVPVVTTPVGGITEMIADERSGLLVPHDDVPALAAALGRVLDDAALRERLAAGGRTTLEAFDVPTSVDALLDAFAAAGSAARG